MFIGPARIPLEATTRIDGASRMSQEVSAWKDLSRRCVPTTARRPSSGLISRWGKLLRRPFGEVESCNRLGGKDAITAVVDDFVAGCANDSRINAKFARSDIARLKSMLVDQVCEATGGPCTYVGRNMKGTHEGMGVTTGEFDALMEDLVST